MWSWSMRWAIFFFPTSDVVELIEERVVQKQGVT